jgi:hypothetical protein
MKLDPKSLFTVIKGVNGETPFFADRLLLGPGLIGCYTTMEEAQDHARQAVDKMDAYEKYLRAIQPKVASEGSEDDIPF